MKKIRYVIMTVIISMSTMICVKGSVAKVRGKQYSHTKMLGGAIKSTDVVTLYKKVNEYIFK